MAKLKINQLPTKKVETRCVCVCHSLYPRRIVRRLCYSNSKKGWSKNFQGWLMNFWIAKFWTVFLQQKKDPSRHEWVSRGSWHADFQTHNNQRQDATHVMAPSATPTPRQTGQTRSPVHGIGFQTPQTSGCSPTALQGLGLVQLKVCLQKTIHQCHKREVCASNLALNCRNSSCGIWTCKVKKANW